MSGSAGASPVYERLGGGPRPPVTPASVFPPQIFPRRRLGHRARGSGGGGYGNLPRIRVGRIQAAECVAFFPVDLRVEPRLLQLLERHSQLFDLVGDRVEGIAPELLRKNGLEPV